jgi:hypothetical protein
MPMNHPARRNQKVTRETIAGEVLKADDGSFVAWRTRGRRKLVGYFPTAIAAARAIH